jgi:hypothetical protein
MGLINFNCFSTFGTLYFQQVYELLIHEQNFYELLTAIFVVGLISLGVSPNWHYWGSLIKLLDIFLRLVNVSYKDQSLN